MASRHTSTPSLPAIRVTDMDLHLDDEQAHNVEKAVRTILNLLEIAAERDDAETPMSLEGAQLWAREMLTRDFHIRELSTTVEPHGGWHLDYQLCGSLPYYDPSLRSQYKLRPVIAHLSEGTTGPVLSNVATVLGAEMWCVYWVDEIGLNDWIEWFDSHIKAADHLGRLVAAESLS